MASHSGRVFSATMARESLINQLASISPTVSPTPANCMPQACSSTIDMSGISWIDNSLQPQMSHGMIEAKIEKQEVFFPPISYNPAEVSFQQVATAQIPQYHTINAQTPITKVRKQGRPASTTKKRSRSASTSQKSPGDKSKLPRYDTSLGLLTKKFIQLMKDSKDGILDLNNAACVLSVQKRRIYDITNVLEGVKLIEKCSKNNVQWITQPPKKNDSLDEDLKSHEREVKELKDKEDWLDHLIRQRQTELEILSDSNSKYSYVTYQDIRGVRSFKDQIVICIKAPQDTKLEVPDPGEKIQMLLKSTKGEIEVYLCPDPTEVPSPTKSPCSPEDYTDMSSEISSTTDLSDRLSQVTSPMHKTVSQTSPELLKVNAVVNKEEVDSAFIEEDSASFIALSPVVHPDDYLFSLDESEGIAELFDINATALPNSDLKRPS